MVSIWAGFAARYQVVRLAASRRGSEIGVRGGDRGRDHAAGLGRHQVLRHELLGREFERCRHDEVGGPDIEDRLLVGVLGLPGHGCARRADRGDAERGGRVRQIAVVLVEQRDGVVGGGVGQDDAPDHIALQRGDRRAVHRRDAGEGVEIVVDEDLPGDRDDAPIGLDPVALAPFGQCAGSA